MQNACMHACRQILLENMENSDILLRKILQNMSTGCENLQKMPATWMILKKDLNFLEGSRNICRVLNSHQYASKSFKVRPLVLEVSIFGEKNVIKQKLKLNRETKIKVFFTNVYK